MTTSSGGWAQSTAAQVASTDLAPVSVTGSRTSQLGVADSASVGIVTQQQLEARTVYRPGELLEATPGLIVSQHSGEGKANQFYLRGFNLDHGTDLRTTVDGMLVNQRSHAHGQGWTDLNFLIPELATELDTARARTTPTEGDFASAGAVSVRYADQLDRGIASVGLGQNGYRRVLLADSPAVGERPACCTRWSCFTTTARSSIRTTTASSTACCATARATQANGFNVTAMGYRAPLERHRPDPAARGRQRRRSGRFDAIDPTDGGKARRYSLSGAWRATPSATARPGSTPTWCASSSTCIPTSPTSSTTRSTATSSTSPTAASPPAQGRAQLASPAWAGQSRPPSACSCRTTTSSTACTTRRRARRLSTTRQDHIVETSARRVRARTPPAGATGSAPWPACALDHYRFDVDSDSPANSRQRHATASPARSSSLIFGPWAKTEFYVNAGSGFHSNDARGTTITRRSEDAATRPTG